LQGYDFKMFPVCAMWNFMIFIDLLLQEV